MTYLSPGIGGGGVGGALTNPQMPSRGASAPQAQMNLWQKFQQKLTNDPNFRMALMTTGLNMMRTPKLGESGYDVFADASLQGMGTLDQLRRRDVATERQEKLDELTGQRTAATVQTAETGAARVEQAGEQFAETQADAEARTQILRDRLDLEKKKLREGETGPERMLAGAVSALIQSGRYPNTPEGVAEARLYASGLSGQLTSRDMMSMAMDSLVKLRASNIYRETPLTESEMTRTAFEDVQAMSEYFGIPEQQTGEDQYEGVTITDPRTKEAGVVQRVPGKEDTYVIQSPTGVSREYNGDQIRAIKTRTEREAAAAGVTGG